MGYTPTEDSDIVIDIESCENTIKLATPALLDDKTGNMVSFTVDRIVKIEKPSSDHSNNQKPVDELSLESGKKNNKRENRKSMSAKKPPKPPRPPRGLSLDAADQKLIKEISELAMIKRAKMERMKALKKRKEPKTSSVSASSSGNLIAILFTLLFCVVIIFQGCQSSRSSPQNIHGIPSASSPTGWLDSNAIAAAGGNSVLQDSGTSGIGVALTSINSPNVVDKDEGKMDLVH